MTPAARLQATIEILDEILAAQRAEGLPADRIVQTYCRTRRYMGSGDRRAVTGMVYDILRQQGRLTWLLGCVDEPVSARSIALTFLVEAAEIGTDQAVNLFVGGKYGPVELSLYEKELLDKLNSKRQEKGGQMPDWAAYNIPEELLPQITAVFGDDTAAAMAGFAGRAPVDLRVNSLRVSRQTVLHELPEASPCPYAPQGIRLPPGSQLATHPLVQDGLVAIQDEASQIAALLVGARAGETIIDYCAGAGGKSLALANSMDNTGSLWAHDVRPEALAELRKRAAKADAPINVARETGQLPRQADRVLVDAPCSSSGTWRRNPDGRWRLTLAALQGFAAQQDTVLAAAAQHVRPGGLLVYVVCSFLPIEGSERVAAFTGTQPGFDVVPFAEMWADKWSGEAACPETLSEDPRFLLLAPHKHGCDGFFVAVLRRREGV